MKSKIALLLVTASILLIILSPFASALKSANLQSATSCADALKSLGLFMGTDAGYELERAPTRIEATTVLVRLLNKAQEAADGSWSIPFTDVPSWGTGFVGYAYKNGIVNGISDKAFGSTDTMSAAMYLTLTLRALGYSDAKGDFSWDNPFDLAKEVGILPDTADTSSFMRGDIVLISWSALYAKVKGTSTTLSAKLISEGAFTASAFAQAEKTAATAGNSGTSTPTPPTTPTTPTAPTTPSAPATPSLPTPSGSSKYQSNSEASVDVGYIADGYIRVAYTGGGSARIKVMLTGPNSVQYTYDLSNNGSYEVFPLSAGNGSYSLGVYVNIGGNKYSTAYTTEVKVTLSNEFGPFLYPNQYVNYSASSTAATTAATLTSGLSDEIEKVKAVYRNVVDNYTYDYNLAATVQSGYVPNLESVMSKKSGICFDYASLMTAMLRSVGIPTKLVIGYTGEIYHAWISVYTTKSGWVSSIISFDGSTWKLMDPTFASTGNESYTASQSNYTAKFYY